MHMGHPIEILNWLLKQGLRARVWHLHLRRPRRPGHVQMPLQLRVLVLQRWRMRVLLNLLFDFIERSGITYICQMTFELPHARPHTLTHDEFEV